MISLPSLGVLIVIGLSFYYFTFYRQSPWRRLPPGPTGIPLLGNLFQLGPQQWTTFSGLRKVFGAMSPLMLLIAFRV